MTSVHDPGSDEQTISTIGSKALSKVVIYDPLLLATLPSDIVGVSGMTALGRCAEALWAANTGPITDALALDGARRIGRYLFDAYASSDIAARGQVLIASCLTELATCTTGYSIHHAICDLLCDTYSSPRAITRAIMLPYVVKFVRSAVEVAYERLAAAMDTDSDDLAATIWSLGRRVGTPPGLRAIGITERQAAQTAEMVMSRGVMSPRALNSSLVHRLMEAAWRGMAPLYP